MAIAVVLRAAEVKLMEALGAIDNPDDWLAVDFHLNRLLEQYQSDYQIKIAVNLMHDLLKDDDGGIYLLSDRSISVLCRRMERTVLNKLIFQLRYLYMDDPLAYTEAGEENPDFSTMYDLSKRWQDYWELSSRRMAMTARKTTPSPKPVTAAAAKPSPVLEKAVPAAPTPRSATRLGTIEDDLRRVDISGVIRRQPVCAAIIGTPVRRVFDELYMHIAHLRKLLAADADFFSNRWLFKYMTQILDERMIALIRANPDAYMGSPVSLNLNVETLLSSWFAEFDAMVKPAVKVSVVIEVPVVDVFADLSGFSAARQEAQKLGYRVCIDGLTAASFAQLNRERLGADLVKLQWNADVAGDLNTPQNRDLAQVVRQAGSNRVILCRCDNKQAVDFGQALGISLFQGRYLDSLIDPDANIEN